MITLNLLHPTQLIPVQSWTFKDKSVVRIGRSKDNDVVVHSAVVSRLHVELHRQAFGWEVLCLGTNGTYCNGERITQVKALDGMVIRLGTSGPKMQISIDDDSQVWLKANTEKQTPVSGASLDSSKELKTFLTPPKVVPVNQKT